MRGLTHWNYKPFTHLINQEPRMLPVVCRVAPGVSRFEIEWYDHGSDGPHALRWRVADTDEWNETPLDGPTAAVENLADMTDYEFRVVRVGAEGESQLKYAHTSFIPGTVINYIHPREREINPLGYCPSSPTSAACPPARC